MREAVLEEADEGIRMGGRKINNLWYADTITLLAGRHEGANWESEDSSREIASEKADLQLNVEKTKIMATKSMDSFSAEEDGEYRIEMKRRFAQGRVATVGLEEKWNKVTKYLDGTK